MAITFEIIQNTDIGSSGLGFYGSGGFGTSVPLFTYQGSTFATSADGSVSGPEARNVKYLDNTYSGCQISAGSGALTRLNSGRATLIINFAHTSAVKVQNAQLRIWDRTNINYPASGVITKVAEVVNFNGTTYTGWTTNNGDDFTTGNVVGSGDAFWWGAPWPDNYMYSPFQNSALKPYYQNSVGNKFYNFTVSQYQSTPSTGNPDSRLSGLTVPAKETVGGTGLIVPLLDSPGSGGRYLVPPLGSGIAPKYSHYVNQTYQGLMGATVTYPSSTYLASGYGGTGYDTRHTWRVALSSAPLSISSKQYGLYVSLEYL